MIDKEKRKEYITKYRELNKEILLKYQREYYLKNIEKSKERSRITRLKNKKDKPKPIKTNSSIKRKNNQTIMNIELNKNGISIKYTENKGSLTINHTSHFDNFDDILATFKINNISLLTDEMYMNFINSQFE